jgi:hypothetical protein
MKQQQQNNKWKGKKKVNNRALEGKQQITCKVSSRAHRTRTQSNHGLTASIEQIIKQEEEEQTRR